MALGLFGIFLVVSAAEPAPTEATTDPARWERARQHFEAGNTHYVAQRYERALEEFTAGYALVPRPSFLLNMGQTYRKLGDLRRAKDAYLDYMRTLPEASPLRDQTSRIVAEIELELRERPPVEPAPPPTPPAPESPPLVVARVEAAPAADARTNRTLAGILVGAAGVGLVGAGVVFGLAAKRASDDLSQLDREMGSYDAGKDRAGRRNEVLGLVFLGAGGAALVAGAVLLLQGRAGAPVAVAVAPAVGPTAAGAVVTARF